MAAIPTKQSATTTTTTTTRARDAVRAQPGRDAVRAQPEQGRDARTWTRGFENLSREHGFISLRVEGELPAELRGTFYRNGPGRFDVAGERLRHWFDGDGAVTAVRLNGKGIALGASKLVATSGRERELRAGKRLYGAYNTPMARPIRELFLGDKKNPANTSVLVHDGKLYATCEAGAPYELSAEDLSTLGASDLDGAVTSAFSAHPHRVESRKATYGFGLGRGKDTKVECYALRDGERTTRLAAFTLQGARMNHDFAATEKNLVFFFAPVYFSLWNLLLRRGLISGSSWRVEQGTEIVVVPIDSPDEIIRFTVPAFYMEHVVNAFELPGGEIAIDYIHYANLRDFEDFVGGVAAGAPERPLLSTIQRAIVNPSSKTLRHEMILDEHVELPRVSPLVETLEHRITYAVAFGEELAAPSSILKHDRISGRVDRYAPGSDRFPSEAVFVPRSTSISTGRRRPSGGAASAASAEDDGWLLTLVLDGKSGTSHLEVLDAARLDEGPLARCHFDQAIPFGFHGLWNPAG